MPSGYQAMWLFALFDLPVDSKQSRRHYARFRKLLIKQGFNMLQFSVYARYFPSEEEAAPYRRKIRLALPPDGQVRLLSVTERQFARQEIFYGRKRANSEDPPSQLLLF